MTVCDDGPLLQQFQQRLCARLRSFRVETLDDARVKELRAAVNRVRANYVARGLALPPLTVFALPEKKAVEVFRADLEPAAVAQTIIYMMKVYGAGPADITWGLKRAYPDYERARLN